MSLLQTDHNLLLASTPGRLQLIDLTMPSAKPFYIDFLRGKMGYRQAHRRTELIVKACGVKSSFMPYVIDATAGLGQDAMVLAQHGCRVLMLERHETIARLLEDGLRRWRREDSRAANVQLTLKLVTSEDYLAGLSADKRPDVVYLDPMFPQREKSALVKKEMQLLQRIVGETPPMEALFAVGLQVCKKRLVVKRPLHAPCLLDRKPTVVYRGRRIRFDVYTPAIQYESQVQ